MKDLKRTRVKSTTLNLHIELIISYLLLGRFYIAVLVEKVFRKIMYYVICS
jgi:hypothetical protein